MINLIWFSFGFTVGFLFNIILKIIKHYLYMKSKKAKRRAFKKRMDDLMK